MNTAYVEKNQGHNGRTIVWVQNENGISFLACPALSRYYAEDYNWKRPGDYPEYTTEYTASPVTGEIIDVKRVKSRIKLNEEIIDTFWEIEEELDALMHISEMLYGTCDCDSPLWFRIESLYVSRASLIRRTGIKICDYSRVFFDPVRRVAHGLRPLED